MFSISLGTAEIPGEMKNKRYAKFFGGGRGGGGQIRCIMRDVQVANSLRSNDATVTTTSPEKWICVLSVFIAIIHTYLDKCTGTLLDLNSKGPYSSSEREITFRRCLFTFSIKHEIRHLLVVLVRKRQRNEVYEKAWCTCKVVVLSFNPVIFFTRSGCCGVVES